MKKILPLFCLLILLLSACNLPVPAAPTSGLSLDEQAATIVAQTLTAVADENPAIQNTPLASPTADQSPLATATASGPAPTIQPPTAATSTTGTPGTPTATTLTVDSNTNCREGPGTTYKVVIVLVPNTTYQMIGRAPEDKFWIVTEIGKSTPCWVPAEMSNAFGNISLLPVVTPSAPTAAASGSVTPPTGLRYNYTCVYNGANSTITVGLQWTDRSNNENGYRVYRDNTVVVDLPANSTTYTDIFDGSNVVVYTYRISAYNDLGEALGSPISFACSQ